MRGAAAAAGEGGNATCGGIGIGVGASDGTASLRGEELPLISLTLTLISESMVPVDVPRFERRSSRERASDGATLGAEADGSSMTFLRLELFIAVVGSCAMRRQRAGGGGRASDAAPR